MVADGHTDLHQEPVKVEGVIVDDETPNVTNDLEDTPSQHTRHEAPGLGLVALEGVDNHGQSKDGDEDGGGGDAGPISQETGLEGAEIEGAVGQGAKGNEPVGQLGHARHVCFVKSSR